MCFLKNSYFWPKSLFQSSYFLMHFISVLNFCMFMMIVKIFCCTIYFAFHFLPKLISSPFSGSGRNCGVLWPRQIEGASPCFLGCCILSEDMRVWGGIWAVCVCARASMWRSQFTSLPLWLLNSEDKSDRNKRQMRQTFPSWPSLWSVPCPTGLESQL